jgi:resolvase-like protein
MSNEAPAITLHSQNVTDHRYVRDMRLLPYVRLSVLDDASTSPERQIEKIEAYARASDNELVPITEADYDLNVSGAVSPFERDGLGPWLKGDRLSKWDAICVARLDRLTRSLFDFVTLMSWLDARSKTLVCLDPQIDLSTPSGRALASVSMSFAQFERESIAARKARDLSKKYMYYGCVHSIQRDGKCTARRVKAAELETLIIGALLELAGDTEVAETVLDSGIDCTEDIARIAEQIGRLYSEIQVEALAGHDVRSKQESLKRAQDRLTRLHALRQAEAHDGPVTVGQTFRQRWGSLDTVGRNQFLRASEIRVWVEAWTDKVLVHQGMTDVDREDHSVNIDPTVCRPLTSGRTMYGHGMRIILCLGRFDDVNPAGL